VISETIYLVRKSTKAKGAVIVMIESGWLNVLPVLTELRVGVIRILETYHPQADDADACVVALHEQYGSKVFTTDKPDFIVYRTRARKAVDAVFAD
jgi:predicted nucleic acid-binding protein